MYFENFPTTYYTNERNGDLRIVTNILRRVGVRPAVKTNSTAFFKYIVKNGETPESIAYNFYDDANLHYVILMTNDIYDRYHQWPMTVPQFQAYVNDKYSDPSDTHHYEIAQTSGDTTVKINIGTDNTNYPAADIVSNVEHEEAEEDKKRQIKILQNAYVPQFIIELSMLLKE